MPPAQARALGALLLDGGGVATAALVAGLGGPDWAALMEAAGRELLTPELGPALSRPEVAAVVPPEVAEHVRGVRALNAARNARIEAQAREMLPAFGEAGLSPFLLKGSRVFADPDPGRRDRVLRDLDLLF